LRTACRAACPGCARTATAATGRSAFSCTGYPKMAVSTTWTSPCPGGAAGIRSAPPAPPAPPASPALPQAGHPWPPIRSCRVGLLARVAHGGLARLHRGSSVFVASRSASKIGELGTSHDRARLGCDQLCAPGHCLAVSW